jgi:diguanylate cyclase (GGDEF)-like protein
MATMLLAKPWRPPTAVLVGTAGALTVFAFDLTQPLGIAGGAPYATLLLFGLLAHSPRTVIVLAIESTILTLAGSLLSPAGANFDIVLIDRLIGIVLIWMTAVIAIRHLEIGDQQLERLEREAVRDPLTELFNRRHVFTVVENELRRYHRYGERCAVILIDADHFKRINDEYGHPAGDVALRQIAEVCRRSIRDSDIAGRFGGEEFIVVLPHADARAAAVVAERIRATMAAEDVVWQDRRIRVTLSLSVAEVGPDTDSLDTLLKAADQALYAAKSEGRNRVHVGCSYLNLPREAA